MESGREGPGRFGFVVGQGGCCLPLLLCPGFRSLNMLHAGLRRASADTPLPAGRAGPASLPREILIPLVSVTSREALLSRSDLSHTPSGCGRHIEVEDLVLKWRTWSHCGNFQPKLPLKSPQQASSTVDTDRPAGASSLFPFSSFEILAYFRI